MNRLFHAGLWLATAAGLMAQTAPATWEIAHPDAKLLMGADLRSMRASQVGQSLGAQAQQAQQAGPMAFMAFQVLNEIDKVFVSSPGNKTPGSKQNPPFLLVVEGTFPEEHLMWLRTGPLHVYRAVKIYGPSKVGNPSFALPDEHTVLIGDDKSVRDAIDRHGRAAAAANALQARAAELASKNDIWLIAKDSMSNLQPAGVANPFAAEIAGMEASVSMHDGFYLEVSLDTKTEAGARQLAQMLSAQLETALATKLDRAQSELVMRSFHINSEGNRMAMNLTLTKEQLEEQIRTIQTQRAMGLRPAAPAPEPKSNAPRTIKIYGLDDGVREIPLKP